MKEETSSVSGLQQEGLKAGLPTEQGPSGWQLFSGVACPSLPGFPLPSPPPPPPPNTKKQRGRGKQKKSK